MDKLKVLCLFDSPATATGFAQVSRNILNVLLGTEKYEPTVVGINHSDWYDQKKFPYAIYEAAPALVVDPRYRDLYGRQRFLDFLSSGKFDLVFTLQDTFILEDIAHHILKAREEFVKRNRELGTQKYKLFQWIYYFPIDGTPKANWITKSAALADFPVCYTEWGKKLSIDVIRPENPQMADDLQWRMRVIHHGTNLTDFHLVDPEESKKFRHDYFQGRADGKYLIINVNRNQPRKDLARTLAAFDQFVQKYPQSFLYLHAQAQDMSGNLLEVARSFPHLHLGQNWTMPQEFGANRGIPIDQLNSIYNAADCLVTTTLGEGWGLSLTEAMATKTLVIAPRNTSIPEILGENEERGLIAECGHEHVFLQNDNEIPRPLTSIDSLVEKMAYAHDHPDEVRTKVDAAYDWIQQYDWAGAEVGAKWLQVFKDAELKLLKEKWVGEQKVGRNDDCPCGSGKKWKKCHGA